MKATLTFLFLAAAVSVCAQAPAAFDSSKAWEHLRQQVAIGPRPSGTAANTKTRQYIEAELTKLGIKYVEQPFDPPRRPAR